MLRQNAILIFATLLFVFAGALLLVVWNTTTGAGEQVATFRESVPLYATMTTLPERIKSDLFKQVVSELFIQKVEFLVLNIPTLYKRTGELYEIPDWVTKDSRIIVNRCEDVGPATKILGGLHLLPPQAKVIVVDDDIIYKRFAIAGLLNYYEENADGFSCWNVTKDSAWGDIVIPSGFSGCIARGEILKKIARAGPVPQSCRMVDDHWFGWSLRTLGIPVEDIDASLPWHHSIKRKTEHPKWFELRLDTNRPMEASLCLQALQDK
jgi:hypothetical protein